MFAFSSLTLPSKPEKTLWMPCRLPSPQRAPSWQPSWIHFLLGGAECLHPWAPMHTLPRFSRNIPVLKKFCGLGPGPIHTPLVKHLLPLVSRRKNPNFRLHPVAWWFYLPFSAPAPLCYFFPIMRKSVCPQENPQHSLCSEPPGPQKPDLSLSLRSQLLRSTERPQILT